ncbi:MAG: hypothetical protein IPM48_07015 [Saprospiraceae bacterium]|nr:hypothetical protein [Saprospiraceae bacterium]
MAKQGPTFCPSKMGERRKQRKKDSTPNRILQRTEKQLTNQVETLECSIGLLVLKMGFALKDIAFILFIGKFLYKHIFVSG